MLDLAPKMGVQPCDYLEINSKNLNPGTDYLFSIKRPHTKSKNKLYTKNGIVIKTLEAKTATDYFVLHKHMEWEFLIADFT